MALLLQEVEWTDRREAYFSRVAELQEIVKHPLSIERESSYFSQCKRSTPHNIPTGGTIR
jgi:hypothetical protein